jgi:hypothetical protein
VIAAIRRCERNGAIDLPSASKRGRTIGDRVQIFSGAFTSRFGLCANVLVGGAASAAAQP